MKSIILYMLAITLANLATMTRDPWWIAAALAAAIIIWRRETAPRKNPGESKYKREF